MSIKSTNTYLLKSNSIEELKPLIVALFQSQIDFEILDPRDLEGDTNKINYYVADEISRPEKQLTEKIQLILDSNTDLEESSMFTDLRPLIKTEELEANEINYNHVKEVVHNFADSKNKVHDIEIFKKYLSKIELFQKFSSLLGLAFNFEPKNKKANSSFWFVCVNVPVVHQKTLEQIAKNCNLVNYGVNWSKKISVWRSNSAFEPFRALAQDLGTVSNKDIDSTPLITFFFCTFFAFCLADAVYGLVLSMVAGFLLIRSRTKPSLVGISKIFFFSGILTFLVGVATGSWAGDIISPEKGKLLDSLGIADWGVFKLLRSLQFIDPINTKALTPANIYLSGINLNPIVAMLGFSLLLGLVVIMSGYTLNTINLYRNKETSDANTSAAWLFLISSVLFWIVDKSLNTNLGTITNIILILAVISIFIFNSGTNLLTKLIGGFGSLWGLIGFFADILSFTRLIAVGLTGGIIGSVINLLSSLVFNSISVPFLNILVLVLMLSIGHIFNFVISLFGAYINPLRLSYVEYLPKFLLGSERNMMPETISLTHHKLAFEKS